ncbi:MAG: response regulator [Anaerolineaceae bacterium]|nr:response regulator [Anaerolineaceae bacterium]
MPKSKIVLHVEDNPENRLLVKRILQASGYTLYEAENASQTMEILTEIKPGLILMDINIPEMDGYSLTHTIKSMPGMETMPIVAITANVMKGDREKSLQAGCDGYIQKPIDVDTFVEQIESFLNAAE